MDDSLEESALNHDEDNVQEPVKIAQRETKAVWWSRALVLLVLLTAAVALGTATFLFIQNEEQEDFKRESESLSLEIIELSQENVKKVFGVLEALSLTVTSLGRQGAADWPFFTIPDFEVHAVSARNSSSALLIAFTPLVTEEQRSHWELYSTDNQGWISNVHGNDSQPEPIAEEIWTRPPESRLLAECSVGRRRVLEAAERVPAQPGSGPYAPVWLLSPPPPVDDTSYINYNMFDRPVFQKAVDFIDYTRKPVFLDVCVQSKWFGVDENSDNPQTIVMHPVFSEFEQTSKIIGHLLAVIPWNVFFEHILSPEAPKATVVMENTCDEVFTYQVEGDQASFVGEEDFHDKKYSDMAMISPFADFANPQQLHDAGLGDHCVYTISAYPTHEMEHSHTSTQPILFTVVVVLVFAFTSLFFVLYDWFVRHRQDKVMTTATAAHAVVAELFPANVREKVFSQAQDKLADKGAENPFTGLTLEFSSKNANDSKPNADLFPEATVMFADISGFTAWSSSRDPSQVFLLLESVYNAFDEIAKSQGVFKVETIGDCYVAVCGLPTPRKRHAAIMTRFARQCLFQLNEITLKLEDVLGPGTRELDMRVGLHSGAVIAGVLRGERARFQLFGDTVNVASRMESTGQRRKIQVSKETADLLRADGKGHWLEPRADAVVAKGKGELQTFWVTSGMSSEGSGVDSSNDESLN